MSKAPEHIQNLLKTLPNKPGVYQHIDKEGKILYIGKAKNLKKRVNSYFTKSVTSARIAVMIKKVSDIRTIVTDSEGDALLLENNLIKEHQPRYNINLKDDKSYPYITIKNERFPRIYGLRNIKRNGSEYYGPYPSVKAMRAVLELIKQMYPTRTCKYVLSKENIENGKFKTCLEYQIGNCKGPCENLQNEEDYNADVDAARKIIKGQLGEVKRNLKVKMADHAASLEFEEAQHCKDRLDALEKYAAKSTVVSFKMSNIDVFSVSMDAEFGYVNYLKIVEGAVVQSYTVEMKKKLEEEPKDFLHLAIPEIRDRFGSTSKRIFTSHPIDLKLEGVDFVVPQKGEKKKIVDLSVKNALYYRQEKLKNIQKFNEIDDKQKDIFIESLIKNIELKSKKISQDIMSKCRMDSKINTITRILSNKSILYSMLKDEDFIPYSVSFDNETSELRESSNNSKNNEFINKLIENFISNLKNLVF